MYAIYIVKNMYFSKIFKDLRMRLFFKILLLFIIVFNTNIVFSQNIVLPQNYNNAKDINEKLNILYQLVDEALTLDSVDFYYNEAFKISADNDSLYIDAVYSKGNFLKSIGMYDSAIFYFDFAITEAEKRSYQKTYLIFLSKGFIEVNMGNFDEAEFSFDTAKTIARTFADSSSISQCYNGLGTVFSKTGNYDEALKNYQLALNIVENSTDKSGLSSLYNNIGLIQKKQKNYDKAKEYFEKSLQVSIDNKDTMSITGAHINIATVLNATGQYEEAKQHLLTALEIIDKTGNLRFKIYCLNILGDVYKSTDSLDRALEIYSQVLDLNEILKIRNIGAATNLDIAEINLILADSLNSPVKYSQSVDYAEKGLGLAKQINALPLQNRAYGILYKAYSGTGNYHIAFNNAVNYIETNDILFNKEKTDAIEEMEAKYESEKKQQEIEKQKLEIDKKNALMKKQAIVKNALMGGSLLLLFIAFLIYRGYRRKKRDNNIIQTKNGQLQQANEEIIVQRDVLQEQKQKIEEIHNQLKSSINYAERIQLASMPSENYFNTLFDDYFLFFKPLQIVSGDFYWAKKIGNHVIFTVADCTGHGVPGAFVSMLGISLLNEITQQAHITDPKDVLEVLREKIKESLSQTNDFGDSKDGMDMALCDYNTETKELTFAGANNPAILIRKEGELTKLAPVRNPVAVYFIEKPFKSETVKMNEGDMIYLFSDGIVDQFGGERVKKYTVGRLKKLLAEIHSLPVNEQKQIIEDTLISWMSTSRQIDDILLMGVKF